MTTVACNTTTMAADKLLTGGPMHSVTKLFRVGASIIGVCGKYDQALRFVEWRRNPDVRPTFVGEPDVQALELTQDGKIIWWGIEMIPVQIHKPFYAIGMGAEYALGAMSAGKSPQSAVKIASVWDSATGSEVQIMKVR